MFNFNFNLYCVAAVVLGLLLGYLFAYSGRQQQPNANEIAGLLGTVLGGGALSLIEQFKQCGDALALYVIGVAVGYALYVFVLQRNWSLVEHLQSAHGLKRAPLLPWLASDPCCPKGHAALNANRCCCIAGSRQTEKE